MNAENLLRSIEEVAFEAQAEPERLRLDLVRDDPHVRRVLIKSVEARIFENTLGNHLSSLDVRYMNEESDDTRESLEEILKRLRKSKVVQESDNGLSALKSVDLTGPQVVDAYYYTQRPGFEDMPEYTNFLRFADMLVENHPISPIVVKNKLSFRDAFRRIAGKKQNNIKNYNI